MKTKFPCFIACTVVSSALAGAALAADGQKSTSQQSRFAACAHESKGLRGDDHQNFMSECLKGHVAEAHQVKSESTADKASADAYQPQSRMKACNAEAGRKDLHGDERRTFMSVCLKG